MFSEKDNETLQILEKSLWQSKTRFDKDYMEKILHPDFFEFGRSGKVHSRIDCINELSQELKAKLSSFQIHFINENIALLTYVSEVQEEKLIRANRSSLWIKAKNSWQLRFHQGTAI